MDSKRELARHYVNGEWVSGAEWGVGEARDPADGSIASRHLRGSAELAEAAISAARRAFLGADWGQSPRLRAQVLHGFADRLESIQESLTETVVRENGKTWNEAHHEIAAAVSEARYYAGLARNVFGRVIETAPGKVSTLTAEPVGVAAIIVPWNAPVTLLVRSLAPALAAGCTSVIKPSTQTALSNARVVECLVGAPGLPNGVVNSVNGEREDVGAALVSSPSVDIVSFTGSSSSGKAIMAEGAKTLKRMSLELGGKAPAIVFPDADLNRAIPEIARCALVHAGQMCVAVARVLVHESIYEEVARRLVAAFAARRVGPGLEKTTEMGPLIDAKNQRRLVGWIERANDEGEVLLRGEATGGPSGNGAFVTPTLFAIDDLSSPLIQEELFGPIVSIERFGDEAEAVTKANATRFGLAASVWTNDLHRANRVARRLRSGTVWQNCHMRLLSEAETGGFGESGVGRLHGVEGLQDFLETKHIYAESC